MGFLTCVNPLMFNKASSLAEALFTVITLIRSLSSVDSLMSSKRVFPGEFFPTFTAFVKLLSSTKDSPTTSAYVGASFCHEGPSAEGRRQLACAFCLHHVHRYSPSQILQLFRVSALILSEEFLSIVLFLVLVEVCTEPELSPIGLTLLPGFPLLVIH